MKFSNCKLKYYYYSTAFIALINSSSLAQAMDRDDLNVENKNRIHCLWHLGTEFRVTALGFLERTAFKDPSNFKSRINYLKKLGEFLQEKRSYPLNLDILKPENEKSPLSTFYQETEDSIKRSSLPDLAKDFQLLKLKTFYNRFPQVNSSIISNEILTNYKNISSDFDIGALEDKVFAFKALYIDPQINIDELKNKLEIIETREKYNQEKIQFFRKKLGKGYFKLALQATLQTTGQADEKSTSRQENFLEQAKKQGFSLAYYYLGKLYNNEHFHVWDFYKPYKASELYQEIARENPLAAYEFAKILEVGISPTQECKEFVPINKQNAKKFRNFAAKKGHPYALYEYAKDLFNENQYEQGLSYLKVAAESGHSKSQLELAQSYERGIEEVVPPNPSGASFWYKKAAHQNEEGAYYAAGYAYETDQNLPLALCFYEKSSDKRAKLRLGKVALKQGGLESKKLALKHFQEAAGLGDTIGNYYLGMMKFKGQGTKPLPLEAFENFTVSAEQGNLKAYFRLGIMKQFGIGTNQSYPEAILFYEKTGQNAAAFYFLGDLYKRGLGVEKNNLTALNLWEKATDLGHKQAAYKAGKLCLKLGKEPTAKNMLEKASIFLQKASPDCADTLFLLGMMHEGVGLQKNISQAIEYYEKAGKKGHALAHFNLGRLYKKSFNNIEKSFYHYSLASQGNHLKARYKLQDFYLKTGKLIDAFKITEGLDKEMDSRNFDAMKQLVIKGHQDALAWFEKKASENNPQAQLYLGKLLEEGNNHLQEGNNHPPQDLPKAIEFYKQASDKGKRSAKRRLADLERVYLLDALGISK